MTESDYLLLQKGGTPIPTRIENPKIKNSFTPAGVNEFNLSQPMNPTERDFNGIPINEMEFASQFSKMDKLHAADAVAKEYHRGQGLKDLKKNVGDEAFKNIYKTIKPQLHE